VVLAIGSSSASLAVASPSTILHQSKPKPHKVITSLTGTWSGSSSGAFVGTFTLHWTQLGSNLTGTITLSNPSGKYSVSGAVHGSAISFGAVGAGATYTGSVSAKSTSMSGNYNSPRAAAPGTLKRPPDRPVPS
jgi:hypothetical protein